MTYRGDIVAPASAINPSPQPVSWPRLSRALRQGTIRAEEAMALIVLYCQPGARATRLAGWHDGKPKVQLHAPPVDGAANDALVAFVAQRCGVPRARVRIVSGHTSRIKRVAIDGIDDDTALGALSAP